MRITSHSTNFMLAEINKSYISGAPHIFENMTVSLLHKDKENV
jgi:hypothetical protein